MGKDEGSMPEPISLEALSANYSVIGELAGREDARTYVGTRRSDSTPILITVAHTPKDDDGNALSLLAADTNLLATLSHRNLLPIIEGEWVGTDAFAVVSERVAAPALDELLAREVLSFPRIAAILREVNGLLDWARQQKIVHRAVTPDTLFIESGSDRVLAAFAISPIPFGRVSPIGVDARTIALLAKTMLAQHPDIAGRIVEQTDRLLELSHTAEEVPDIPDYIAMIAMADALKSGEIELAHASNAIQELQQSARAKLEAERAEHEREMAEQKKAFAKEREEFERALASDHEELAKEREALAEERAAHERDLEAFATERNAVEGRAVLYAPTEELPVVIPPETVSIGAARESRQDDRSWWNVGLVAAALVIVIATTTIAITSSRQRSPEPAMATQLSSSRTVDSAPGGIWSSAVPMPSVPDSVMRSAARADTLRRARVWRQRRPTPAVVAPASIAQPTLTADRLQPVDTTRRLDTASALVLPLRSDTLAARDTQPRPPRVDTLSRRRDTLPRPDTLPRRDTLPLRAW